MIKSLALANRYAGSGFAVIPVPLKSKNPQLKDWQNLKLSKPDVLTSFSQEPLNLGVVLGDRSGGLVDIDLDCEEAIRLAEAFLPPTGMIFGRESRPKSHWVYRVPDPGDSHRLTDPDGNGMIAEVRANGCMTIFPGSVHPDGEEVCFDSDGSPAEVNFGELVVATKLLAAACLLLPYWKEGQRHYLALAVAGTLLREGVADDVAMSLIGGTAEAARDEELDDRLGCVESTLRKIDKHEAVTSKKDLAEIIGDRAADRFCEWLGLTRTTKPSLPVIQSAQGAVSIAYGGPAPYSDTANAHRFARRHGVRARYLPNEKHWLVWNGARWLPDAGNAHVLKLAIETVSEMAKEAIDTHDRELQKFAAQSHDMGRLRNMLSLAAGLCTADHEEFDADPWKLNCRSGVVDFRTGELHLHDPSDRMRKMAQVDFDPEAHCPTFKKFLNRIFDGNEELMAFVQRAAGYSVTGRTSEQCLFLCVGNGANGKSTLISVFQMFMGDYAQQTQMDALMTGRAGSIPNDIARLEGARFVAAVEAEAGQRLAEAKIKQLTGGDRLAARFLYGEHFEFTPQFKLWLATNRLPEVGGTDEGIWRRFRVIPFDVTIPESERDGSLIDKLRDELPGILNWVIAGCIGWQKSGLRPPDSVLSATKRYRAAMDVVAQFIEDCCVTDPKAEETVRTLYLAYAEWCHDNGETALAQKSFGQRLGQLGYQDARTGSARKRLGLRLKTSADLIDNEYRPTVGIAAGSDSQIEYLKLDRDRVLEKGDQALC